MTLDDPCDDWLSDERAYSLLIEERIRAKKAGDMLRCSKIKQLVHGTFGRNPPLSPARICIEFELFP